MKKVPDDPDRPRGRYSPPGGPPAKAVAPAPAGPPWAACDTNGDQAISADEFKSCSQALHEPRP